MFETANLDHRVGKAAYRREEQRLREQLLNAQYDLKKNGGFAVLVLIAGVQGSGRGETVNLLNEWMDPRHILTHAFPEPTQEERERPEQWRYWRVLPPKGRIGVFFGAWHSGPILRRVRGATSDSEFAHETAQVSRLEKMLFDEGVLLLKYWFHVTKQKQRQRLKEAGEKPEAPYRKFVKVSETFLRRTSSAEAPWLIIPGAHARYRDLAFGCHLGAALSERLQTKGARRRAPARMPPLLADESVNVLRALKLAQPMSRALYKAQLKRWQGRLYALSRQRAFRSIAVVVAFEGFDASGKGGAIRRVTRALDARIYHTLPVGAPTEEERAQPYLWRFWRHIPARGRFELFDRSWYGRVLVERVEGLAAESDWMRAYAEINDFEQVLVQKDIVLLKFWLAISKDKQLRRFRERQKTPFNVSRSRRRIGATARNGTTTSALCATWSTAPRRPSRRGRWSRRTTSTSRASRC